ncbi:ABC-type sugar transport system, periplasmic component [Rhizobium leguminosarum bv. trifolii WSM597]|uniref:ABC-type sugar transport system, periplasmic component n=1 Tax=Rhizobium leguminosarum bv. trifolii WSM597 TaxID=754764 RepID=J0H9G9_RHILT|nr:LacI family DNA-binding transcriptional regulator [Rhizobium leguminosarum]EJB07045.1 ABC-type sugar transport system, periplasmic component [Rhizobium leguminosarum bv. trifolii WSM597]
MTRPTIADLAKAANVGVSTVDRVLNGRDPVRPQTAERVLSAAEKIGFHGVTAIKKRLENDKPVIKFGFLLKQSHRKLYQMWAQVLTKAVEAYPEAHGRPIIRFVDELAPENTADALLAMSRDADCIGVITSDHPQINHAVDGLENEGIPVFTMISDLTARGRAGYVGNDCVKKGRTAAWFIDNVNFQPGKVAVFVGSHRYLSQELCEMGFRSYFRESDREFQMMETLGTQEEPEVAYEMTRKLLASEENWVGLYVAGGGITGVMKALREERGPAAKRLVVVAHELTNETRAGLAEGIIRVVLSHPARLLADTLVRSMAEAVDTHRTPTVSQQFLPFDIYTAANI